MPIYRDKEIDFKIAEKYYCWKQNNSSWKNQYLSRQEGEGGGLCRSVPATHQSGRRAVLNVSGGSCDLSVQGLRVFWNFSLTQKSRLLPLAWERLDCRHCRWGLLSQKSQITFTWGPGLTVTLARKGRRRGRLGLKLGRGDWGGGGEQVRRWRRLKSSEVGHFQVFWMVGVSSNG